jgi:DNA-binding CsgD family transcriptional regulator
MADLLRSSERRLLELLATGLSTAEAAKRLGRSPAAVRRDLLRSMTALGAASKLEAIVKAIQLGLIDPSRFV